MLLLGIMITADWIASGDTFAFLSTNRSEEQVIADTRRLMKDFLQENHMLHRQASYKIDTFTKLWPDIKPSGMRNLQKTVEKIFADEQEKPLGVILEAPMGCGKTEAGLYAACRLAQRWGKEGFYVALPTAATSNQMYERMNKMLEKLQDPQAKLMHGKGCCTCFVEDNGFFESKWETKYFCRKCVAVGNAGGMQRISDSCKLCECLC